MRRVLYGFGPAVALLLTLGALAACNPAPSTPSATTAPAPVLDVSDAWAAATPNGATVAAGYLNIVNNTDAADTLIAVSSPRAPRVEVHEMAMEGDVMRMRQVERLDVAAGQSVSLAPGGYHLMFMDISAPFVAGESVPIALTFEHAGVIEVELPVRERQAGGGDMNH